MTRLSDEICNIRLKKATAYIYATNINSLLNNMASNRDEEIFFARKEDVLSFLESSSNLTDEYKEKLSFEDDIFCVSTKPLPNRIYLVSELGHIWDSVNEENLHMSDTVNVFESYLDAIVFKLKTGRTLNKKDRGNLKEILKRKKKSTSMLKHVGRVPLNKQEINYLIKSLK